jgi:hypothetical protein
VTFEIESLAKAKLLDVVVLSQKNRQLDENPGAKLTLEMQAANDVLSAFDGGLKSFLFTRTAAMSQDQDELDGIPPVSDEPNLTGIGLKVGTLHWDLELTGYTLVIDHGLGGKSNLEIADCVLGNFRIQPKEGGTVVVKFDVESADVPEKVFGKLATLKTRDIQVTLTAPEVVQESV